MSNFTMPDRYFRYRGLAAEFEPALQPVEDELLVYDPVFKKAHNLRPAAALVYSHCDGRTRVSQVARRLGSRALLEECLAELDAARLIGPTGQNRRRFIQDAGKALLVASVMAPLSSAAASCGDPTIDSITVDTTTPRIDCPLQVTVTSTAPPGCPITTYDWDISSSIPAGETFDFSTAVPNLNQTASAALFPSGAGAYFLVVRATTSGGTTGSNAIQYTIAAPGPC